mgnify:CR=1 FL=1
MRKEMTFKSVAKRATATFLALTLAAGLVPSSVYAEDATSTDATEYTYVLMNIPYEDFYAAEINDGSAEIDAVTSATTSKCRSDMFTGSYHLVTDTNEDGTDDQSQILGITYPVKVSTEDLKKIEALDSSTVVTDSTTKSYTVNNRGTETTTELTGSECLAECNSYSYYVLEDEPNAYKALTIDSEGNISFAATTAETTESTDITVSSFATSSSYGDYEIKVSYGDSANFKTILGVVITTDGQDYAMRQLENIWKNGTDISWTTGYTLSEKHGNDLSGMVDYYESMMGETIQSMTVYGTDSDGNYITVQFDVTDTYVAKKEGASVSATVSDSDLNVTVSNDTAEVYDTYAIDGTAVTCTDGVIDLSGLDLSVGSHTLTVSDADSKYVSLSASFVVSAGLSDGDITLADNAVTSSAEGFDLETYISNVTKITVDDTSYTVSGSDLFNEDGSINLDVTYTNRGTTTSLFAKDGSYSVTITSTGYPDVTGTITKTTAVEESEDTAVSDSTETTATTTSETTAAATSETTAAATTETTTEATTTTTSTTLSVGSTFTVGKATYKVTGANTVTYVKTTSKATKITVPATVKQNGTIYNVTAIGKNAFKNATKVKTIVVKSSKIKSVGKNAFKAKNLKTVKLAKKNFAKIKKLVKKAANSSVTIKKA